MTIQIAVKLPDELVQELDRLVEQGDFASRSQAVRSGISAIVAARRRAEIERRFRQAAVDLPETERELADATRLATEAIHDEPWQRWW